MTTMKAIRVHEYGDAEVLRYEDAPRPGPKEGEVLVRVVAAGVNPIDWKTRAGYLKEMVPLALPWIPGGDFSGVVEQVGSGVTAFRKGDEVFGKADLPRNGSYAEYVVVPSSAVVPKPRTLDHVHAAAVPLAALTAWQALFGSDGVPSLDLAPGQTVLILGATGGVGTFAVQLAKWKGARVVATARHGQSTHLPSLGADSVIDPGHMTDAGEVDAILDLVGHEFLSVAWPQLKQGGAVASTMGRPSEMEAKMPGVRAIGVFTRTSAADLARIAKLIDAGSIKVVVADTLPLESASRAHQLLQTGGVRGKLVLTVGKNV